jgi:hypothetical protein
MHATKTNVDDERKLVEQLVDILRAGRVMRGNTLTMRRKCGGKNCRCTRGELHESVYVGQGAEGTTKMAYVPTDWEADVKEWVRRHQRARALFERLSARAWRALRTRTR